MMAKASEGAVFEAVWKLSACLYQTFKQNRTLKSRCHTDDDSKAGFPRF